VIRSFANLLISLNPTSGQRSWWIVWGAGMIAWLATALPFIDLFTGSMVGIGKYGGEVADHHNVRLRRRNVGSYG